MRLRKGECLELDVHAVAYGGQGVARLDGLVIFVRGAIPGDRVSAKVIRKKRAHAEAIVTEVLEPSSDRVEAPCPYHGFCGGCQWQHVRYERQLAYKKGHIREALARIGSISEVQVHDVIPSEKPLAYRNKMEFSFSDRRWFLPNENDREEGKRQFALGLHVPGTFHKVIDVEACLLQHETGNRILQEVRRHVKDCGIPVYGLKSHRGFWRFLTLRHSIYAGAWMVNLVTSEERREVVQSLTEALCQRIPSIKTVVNNINTKRAGTAVGEREIILTGDGTIYDRIGAYGFQISANSFFQTNALAAERLYQKVAEYAELKGSETVLDLYSGTGTIPVFISGQAKAVIGMEIAQSAVLDANRNCEGNGVRNCQFILGDIRESLSALKQRPHVLIIDPPRAGMHKDVLAKVMALAPERVVYVSCNPTTMARDLAQMGQAYHLLEVQPVDMFPHTYHIEAVARLVRR